MELALIRNVLSKESSIGDLSVDGVCQYVTLEPTMREAVNVPVEVWKIPGKTAIPVGRYEVQMLDSARFKCKTPHLIDVPGFDAIEIHVGNFPRNTSGCILIGLAAGNDYISQSIQAIGRFYPQVQGAIDKGDKVFINVSNAI